MNMHKILLLTSSSWSINFVVTKPLNTWLCAVSAVSYGVDDVTDVKTCYMCVTVASFTVSSISYCCTYVKIERCNRMYELHYSCSYSIII